MQKKNDSLPHIDCVVIGVNAGATLEACLCSLKESNYPEDKIHIIYVDGGSNDDSLSIAGSLSNINVFALHPEYPTPGLGRNCGEKRGTAPFIQFLDSDTILDADWLRIGVQAMEEDVAAVMGHRLEMYPEYSVFNWIGSLEWNAHGGEAESFGGDVLVRRQVFRAIGGYDEELVSGEDPELSRRIRLAGWRILQLDTRMTEHDLAMTNICQYWRRTYRSGYGFAAVIDRFKDDVFWQKEFRRITIRGGGFLALSIIGAIFIFLVDLKTWQIIFPAMAFSLAVVLLFFPRIFRVDYFKEDKGITREQAKIYAWHCSLAVLPDIFGVGRYYLGKFCNRPLRNKRNQLATGSIKQKEG